jgi:hypothetical protein
LCFSRAVDLRDANAMWVIVEREGIRLDATR